MEERGSSIDTREKEDSLKYIKKIKRQEMTRKLVQREQNSSSNLSHYDDDDNDDNENGKHSGTKGGKVEIDGAPPALSGQPSRRGGSEPSVVLEEDGDGLAVVDAADGLCEDGGDIKDLKLGALAAVLVLGHRVRDDDLVDSGGVDATESVSAEDTVGQQGEDAPGPLALEQLGGAGDGVAGVAEVVDQDAGAVDDVANEHHASVTVLGELNGAPFLNSWG